MTATRSSECLKDPFKYQIVRLNEANKNANYECVCNTNKIGVASFMFNSTIIKPFNRNNESEQEEIVYPEMKHLNISWIKE